MNDASSGNNIRLGPSRNTLGIALRTLFLAMVLGASGVSSQSVEAVAPLRILPLGDSITRGSYISRYQSGPHKGQAISLANPDGGGWRKLLQDKLRADGVLFDFVGELNYHSFGRDGVVDPGFDPDHHGLAGFSNQQIMTGGAVPTLPDALESLGVKAVVVPDIVTVLKKHRPDVILLMSGTNGFDAAARDELIRVIGANSTAHLFVATILRQRPPGPDPLITEERRAGMMQRAGWEKVDDYNASLPAIVERQRSEGHRITLVDLHRLVAFDELVADGVHPGFKGMAKMADGWYQALKAVGYTTGAKQPR